MLAHGCNPTESELRPQAAALMDMLGSDIVVGKKQRPLDMLKALTSFWDNFKLFDYKGPLYKWPKCEAVQLVLNAMRRGTRAVEDKLSSVHWIELDDILAHSLCKADMIYLPILQRNCDPASWFMLTASQKESLSKCEPLPWELLYSGGQRRPASVSGILDAAPKDTRSKEEARADAESQLKQAQGVAEAKKQAKSNEAQEMMAPGKYKVTHKDLGLVHIPSMHLSEYVQAKGKAGKASTAEYPRCTLPCGGC